MSSDAKAAHARGEVEQLLGVDPVVRVFFAQLAVAILLEGSGLHGAKHE
ncbi:MAG: hypothetical protein ABTQ32_24095 [Myxococcaceae bacterium]